MASGLRLKALRGLRALRARGVRASAVLQALPGPQKYVKHVPKTSQNSQNAISLHTLRVQVWVYGFIRSRWGYRVLTKGTPSQAIFRRGSTDDYTSKLGLLATRTPAIIGTHKGFMYLYGIYIGLKGVPLS